MRVAISMGSSGLHREEEREEKTMAMILKGIIIVIWLYLAYLWAFWVVPVLERHISSGPVSVSCLIWGWLTGLGAYYIWSLI